VSLPLARSPEGRAAFRRLVLAEHPLFFLDVDGTLAPIVDRPADARVPPATRRVIRWLRRTGVRVVLVSGRSVEGVRRVAPVAVDAILGDHGARVFQGGRVRPWLSADRGPLDRAARQLARRLPGLPGVRLERKDRSLAIHLRLPAEHENRVARRLATLLRGEGLRVLHGHRVLDGQLPGVDKGHAVLRWLDRTRPPGAVLYAGDDTTDDDAFRALARRAVTIAVGPRPRHARFRARDPATLSRWLARLAGARRYLGLQ
jgi:trehalose-phosphatase